VSQADDKILEELLRRRREEPRQFGGPLCGDSELLAAFAEGALAGKAQGDMESHLAACVACREAVARLVRLAPRPAVATPAPQSQVAWWKRWVWAAPALAGVVLVGSFVMFNRQRIVEQPQLVAKEQPAIPAAVPQQPAVELRANESARAEATAKPRSRSAAKEEARAAAPPPPPVSVGAETEAKREKDQKETQVVDRVEAKADVDARARQSQSRDQAQLPAAPAPSQQQTQVFAKAPAEATVGGTASASGQAKPAGAMLRSAPSSLAKAESETATAKPGAMNVLADDRTDQLDKSKKLSLFFRADSKIAQTVRVKGTRQVWTVLSDGRLLLSLDNGDTWKEVAVPERIKSVTARDAGHAEITSVTGRVYRSTDAGASWILVPSQ